MNNLYKKLDLHFHDIDMEMLRGENVFKKGPFEEYRIKDFDYLFTYLKDKIEFLTKPDIVNITEIHMPGAIPHSDTWPSALNVYLNVGNDITYFWKEVTDDPEYEREMVNELKFYQNSKLELIDSFVANINECYLLNTHEIHSVEVKSVSGFRRILRMGWKYIPFSEIHKHIRVINSVD